MSSRWKKAGSAGVPLDMVGVTGSSPVSPTTTKFGRLLNEAAHFFLNIPTNRPFSSWIGKDLGVEGFIGHFR